MRDAAQEVTLSPEAVTLARVRAGELADELRLLGLGAKVHAKGQHHRHPCVEVRGGAGRPLSGKEYFYAAPDDLCDESSPWSFWRGSDMARLAALDDVSAAVAEAMKGLGCGGPVRAGGRELAGAR